MLLMMLLMLMMLVMMMLPLSNAAGLRWKASDTGSAGCPCM